MAEFTQEHWCPKCGCLLFKSSKETSGPIEIKCKGKPSSGGRCHEIVVINVSPQPVNRAYSSERAKAQQQYKEKREQGQ